MSWYIFRHNVAETYIPNGGEEFCSVAHGRRVVSRAKSSAADLVNAPAFRLSPVRLDSPPPVCLLLANLPVAWHPQQL